MSQHAEGIAALNARADRYDRADLSNAATRYRAAAQLLETHDDTGINLSTFGAVGQFVDLMLHNVGQPPHTDNGA